MAERARTAWDNGFVPLPRDLSDHPVLDDPMALAVYLRILFRARHEARGSGLAWLPCGRGWKGHELSIGESLISQNELGDLIKGATRQSVRRALDRIVRWGLVSTRPSNTGTVVMSEAHAQFWSAGKGVARERRKTEGDGMPKVELKRALILRDKQRGMTLSDLEVKYGASAATIGRFLETGIETGVFNVRQATFDRSRARRGARNPGGKNRDGDRASKAEAVLEFALRGVAMGWWDKQMAMDLVELLE